MELIALLILISVSSSCQLTGPKEVHGQSGGSVTVNCQYDLKYKDHVKQWCKGNYYYVLQCSVVVSTEKPEEGRISLTDNKTQGIFSITMDNLMKSDEGQYICVIETPTFKYNHWISIDLKVSQGQPQSSTIGPTTSAAGNTKASVNTTGNTKASVTTILTISPINDFHSSPGQQVMGSVETATTVQMDPSFIQRLVRGFVKLELNVQNICFEKLLFNIMEFYTLKYFIKFPEIV
ncbi:CMRF35-like molecule 5 [Mustelus asterias]